MWICVVLLTHVLAREYFGVIAGDDDTIADFFVDGVQVEADSTRSILPINSINAITRDGAIGSSDLVFTTIPLRFPEIQQGSTLILRGRHDRKNLTREYDASGLGKKPYTSAGSLLLALEDGTISNDQWECRSVSDEFPWDSNNATNWAPAVENNGSCCPWRDLTVRNWKRLSARWIWSSNVSALEVVCRYTKPTAGSHLMDGSPSLVLPSPKAMVQVEMVTPTNSFVRVKVSVQDGNAVISALVIAKASFLRTPTPAELHNATSVDIRVHAEGGHTRIWMDITTVDNFVSLLRDVLPLVSFENITSVDACRVECDNVENCLRIAYSSDKKCILYDVGGEAAGYVLASEAGVRRTLAGLTVRRLDGQGISFLHMVVELRVPVIPLHADIQQLLPGIDYYLFLGPMGQSWEEIAASRLEFTTTGCSLEQCRMEPWPAIHIFGGFATPESLTLSVTIRQRGRVACLPWRASRSDTPPVWFVFTNGYTFNVTTLPVRMLIFNFTSLVPNTPYLLYCATQNLEKDGHIMTQETMESGRILMKTGQLKVSITGMRNYKREHVGQETHAWVDVDISAPSDIACMVQVPVVTLQSGVPVPAMIKSVGKIVSTDSTSTQLHLVTGKLDAFPEIYCTADQLVEDTGSGDAGGGDGVSQQTSFLTLYPVLRFLSGKVSYSSIYITTLVDRMATARCLPVVATFPPPTVDQVKKSSWTDDINTLGGGMVTLEIRDLSSGTAYVMYCHTEELSDSIFKRGMSHEQMLVETYPFRTLGPEARDYEATCDVGSSCHIAISGDGLSWGDRILVSPNACRADCKCAGIQDNVKKGDSCTSISQHPRVNGVGPFPESRIEDPKGAWCYVNPLDKCRDTMVSDHYPDLYVSYKACDDEVLHALPGFPSNGLSTAADSGKTHSWGTAALNYTAGPLYLCWCAGSTVCDSGIHFKLKLGILAVRGPTSRERVREHACRFSTPCIVHFNGFYVAASSSLIAVSAKQGVPTTCFLRNSSVVSFPNDGMAVTALPPEEMANVEASSASELIPFRFGDENDLPMVSAGIYRLCFCSHCDKSIPGQTHVATAGSLTFTGPVLEKTFSCYVGEICDMVVEGLFAQLDDIRLIVAERCGVAPTMPISWGKKGDAGWLNNELAPENIDSLSYAWVPQLGAYGFSAGGQANLTKISETQLRVHWTMPIMPIAGNYELCWRANPSAPSADAVVEFYKFSTLSVIGAEIAPHTGYVLECSRMRPCLISDIRIYQGAGSRVLIVPGRCSGRQTLFQGFPNGGLSFPSSDGTTFSFGNDLIYANGGTYSICLSVSYCGFDMDCFSSFAGTLHIASPLFTANIVDLEVHATNSSEALTFFAHVFNWTDPRENDASVDGQLDTLPFVEMLRDGVYHIQLSISSMRQAENIIDAWQLAGESVRPLQASVPHYICVQYEPCAIYGIGGVHLSMDNRVMVAHTCGERNGVTGFPNKGISSQTLKNGTAFRWKGKIMAQAGSYELCWCWRDCVAPSDFTVGFGVLTISGPRSLDVYTCYQWVPNGCTFSLHGFGMHTGDRIVVQPLETDCSDTSRGHEFPFFPNRGYSFPLNGSLMVDFGEEEIGMPPQSLRLCWCSSLRSNCEQNNLTNFSSPGGILVIESLEEYYKQHKPKFKHSMNELEVVLLLICPLPLACCIFLIGARYRRRLRQQDKNAIVESQLQREEDHARKLLFSASDKDMVLAELRSRRKELANQTKAENRLRPKTAPSKRERQKKTRPASAPAVKGGYAVRVEPTDYSDDTNSLESDEEIIDVGEYVPDVHLPSFVIPIDDNLPSPATFSRRLNTRSISNESLFMDTPEQPPPPLTGDIMFDRWTKDAATAGRQPRLSISSRSSVIPRGRANQSPKQGLSNNVREQLAVSECFRATKIVHMID